MLEGRNPGCDLVPTSNLYTFRKPVMIYDSSLGDFAFKTELFSEDAVFFLSLFSVSFTHFSVLGTTHTGHTSGLILTHEILTSVELHGCKLDQDLAGESL